MKPIALVILSSIFFAAAAVVPAQANSHSSGRSSTHSLAHSLECAADPFFLDLKSQGDNFRALTVLKEKEFSKRGTAQGFSCARLILGEYLRFQEFDLADDWLARIYTHYKAESLRFGPQHRLQAELSYLFGNPAEVESRLRGAPGGADANELNKELNVFAAAYRDPHSAQASCDSEACLQLNQVLNEERLHSRKHPSLALALGILPGAGQVYSGRILAGVGSFVLNSLLIGTTVYAISRKEYAFSILSGTISAGFYLGSIYGGYEAAQRANELAEGRARQRIRGINLKLDVLRLSI